MVDESDMSRFSVPRGRKADSKGEFDTGYNSVPLTGAE